MNSLAIVDRFAPQTPWDRGYHGPITTSVKFKPPQPANDDDTDIWGRSTLGPEPLPKPRRSGTKPWTYPQKPVTEPNEEPIPEKPIPETGYLEVKWQPQPTKRLVVRPDS